MRVTLQKMVCLQPAFGTSPTSTCSEVGNRLSFGTWMARPVVAEARVWWHVARSLLLLDRRLILPLLVIFCVPFDHSSQERTAVAKECETLNMSQRGAARCTLHYASVSIVSPIL